MRVRFPSPAPVSNINNYVETLPISCPEYPPPKLILSDSAIAKPVATVTAKKSEAKAMKNAYLKVVTDTLGISEADLLSRIKAGENPAAIAGAKKYALVGAFSRSALRMLIAL
ncbi:MAG: hypothetical protein FJW46_05275 [Actinobacteria bacterium]|nr:hypothetical protein [Actinomycetota bacterium]